MTRRDPTPAIVPVQLLPFEPTDQRNLNRPMTCKDVLMREGKTHDRPTMTSRERVLKAINHEPTDRMPIDFGMHNSTGISAFAYWNLREYLGLPVPDVDVPDVPQLLARVEPDLLRRFHVDCIMLWPAWSKTHLWNPRQKYRLRLPHTAQPFPDGNGGWRLDRNGAQMRMPANGFFFEGDSADFFEESESEWLIATAREAERIFKETDYFTTYLHNFFGYARCDDPDWLCRTVTEPKELIEENKARCATEIARAGRIVESLGRYVQAVCFNSDLGSQKSPMCRPSLYEEVCAPFVKRICDFIHRNSDMKVFMHCCGSIKPLIPILIDCGIDILNPVQISANNMDARELKAEFGDKIAFWGGGCDTQGVLAAKSPEEVRRHVRENVAVFAPGGGYVFNQVHNILGNVAPENIVAMLDAACEAGNACCDNT